jgi:hypothetical protein
MRAALAGLALALALAGGCRMTPEAPAPGTPGPVQTSAQQCAGQGGSIRPVCRRQSLQCVVAYRDAGKTCTDGDQCAGDCLYEGSDPPAGQVAGACQADSDPCGCKSTVENGRIARSICVD